MILTTPLGETFPWPPSVLSKASPKPARSHHLSSPSLSPLSKPSLLLNIHCLFIQWCPLYARLCDGSWGYRNGTEQISILQQSWSGGQDEQANRRWPPNGTGTLYRDKEHMADAKSCLGIPLNLGQESPWCLFSPLDSRLFESRAWVWFSSPTHLFLSWFSPWYM